MYRLRWIGVVLAIVFMAGCQPLPPAPTPLPGEATTAPLSPLPAPTGAAIDVSPVSGPAVSAVATIDAQGRRFEIDRPIKAGDTVIKGTGLPGTGLAVHDVTRMGVELGAGMVGDDGRFEITVGELTANVRVGITLVEDNDAIWSNPAVLGPQSLVVPMVGIYLDTVVVE